MAVETKDVVVPIIIGLMVNLVSAYLFSLGMITTTSLLIVFVGSFLALILIGVNLKINEMNIKINEQDLNQQKLMEKLKIYERLSKIEVELFKNGKRARCS